MIVNCLVMMTGIKTGNCVYVINEKVKTFGVQMNEGSTQVGSKKLDHGFGIELCGVHAKRHVKFEVEL